MAEKDLVTEFADFISNVDRDKNRKSAIKRSKEELKKAREQLDAFAKAWQPLEEGKLEDQHVSRSRATVTKMRDSATSMMRCFEGLSNYLHSNFDVLAIPPVETQDVVSEVRSLQQHYGTENVKFLGDGKIEVTYPTDFVLTYKPEKYPPLNVGKLKVTIAISRRGGGWTIQGAALTPIRPFGEPAGSNPHPHISGHDICLGEGRAALESAIRDYRLTDAFMIIESVLRTYNEKSPYRKFETYVGKPCKDCGDFVVNPPNSCCGVNGCTAPMPILCERHEPKREILTCGHQACPTHRTKCVRCSKIICNACTKSTRKPPQKLCSTCFEIFVEERKVRKEIQKKRKLYIMKMVAEGMLRVMTPEEALSELLAPARAINQLARIAAEVRPPRAQKVRDKKKPSKSTEKKVGIEKGKKTKLKKKVKLSKADIAELKETIA